MTTQLPVLLPGLQGVSPPRQCLRDQLGFQVLNFALVGEDEEGAVVAGVLELHQRAASSSSRK